jgi:cephalosporin hydroxylase
MSKNPIEKHFDEVEVRIDLQGKSEPLVESAIQFYDLSAESKYSYNFTWMGRPIIQYPQDIVAMQEIIFTVQPDLIIETGIAHGGSLILYASLLELNAACGGPAEASILGVDIDIRAHNKEAIKAHPMSKRIEMVEGSSIANEIVDAVKAKAQGKQRIMVVLDSNHTHEHVLAELEAYAPLVTKGSYCVVFDTVVEDMPKGSFPDRPWDVGNNPKTAVWEYLKSHDEFEIDKRVQHKLLITVAPDGFLKRI